MLEVQSPLPMTEGEQIAFGISTKHLIQFSIGALFAAPVVVVGLLTLPFTGIGIAPVVMLGIAIAASFAFVQIKERTLGELILLKLRFRFRPKLVLYDRDFRLEENRRMTTMEFYGLGARK